MSLIIGFSGKKQSGKTTAVKCLQKQLISSVVVNNFSDALKIIVVRTLVPCEAVPKNVSPIDWVEDHKNDTLPCGMTVRQAMQFIGTDVMRELWTDVWVNAWKHRLPSLNGPMSPGTILVGDVRFPNEVEAIQGLGGKVIRLMRAPFANEDQHSSETALDGWGIRPTGANEGDEGAYEGFDAILDNREMSIAEQDKALWDLVYRQKGWLPKK